MTFAFLLKILTVPLVAVARLNLRIHAAIMRVRLRKHNRATAQQSILVFRTDALGDFLVTLPALKALSEYAHQSGKLLVVAASTKNAEVAKACPWIDKVAVLDRKRYYLSYFYRRGFRRFLATMNPVQALVFPQRDTIASRMALYMPSCQTVIFVQHRPHPAHDYLTSHRKRRWKDLRQSYSFLGALIRWPQRFFSMATMHYLAFDLWEKRILILFQRRLTLSDQTSIQASYKTCLSELYPDCTFSETLPTPDLDWLKDDISSLNLPEQYISISPGCSSRNKSVPATVFADAMIRLHHAYPDHTFIATGLAKEQPLIDDLAPFLPNTLKLTSLCGRTTARQTIAIISGATFALSPDTATGHIAGIFGIKSVVFLGGGVYPGVFFPNTAYPTCKTLTFPTPCRNCQWLCPYEQSRAPYPCLKNITVPPDMEE